MVEAFHLEIVHVIEFHRAESMLRRDVVTLRVNVVRGFSERGVYSSSFLGIC